MHKAWSVWSQHASAMGCEPRSNPVGSVSGTLQANRHLSSLNIKRLHRERWKEEEKATLTLCKSAERLMRYLLQIVISQLVKNHPQKVPFMLVNESSGRLFVQDKEEVNKIQTA